MFKYSYDTAKFSFREKFQFLFDETLESINPNLQVLTREKDQSTIYHKIYYSWVKTNHFRKLYYEFVSSQIQPIYDQPIAYQAIPTFRICLPNNIAVGEFHKDKNYRDESWAKEVKEDNFFLPITNAFDTNTIWVESEEDKGDFAPMNCKYGEFIKWDGSNLTHGNKLNETGKTRISIDFRVMLLSNYKPSEQHSINTPTKFKIGEYYKVL